MPQIRIYAKVEYMGLVDYYKTDLEGEYGGYAKSIISKLKTKYALEYGLDVGDIEVSFVLSVPKRVKMGEIYAGEIQDPS